MTPNDPQTPPPNPNIMPPGGTASPDGAANQRIPTDSRVLPPVESDDEPAGKNSRQISPAIIAAIIGAVATVVAAIIAIIPNMVPQPTAAPLGNYSTSTPSRSATSAPTLTPVPAVAGPFDLTIIYGGENSLTIHIKGESHLFGLAINTPAGSEAIAAAFPSLAVAGYIAPSGMCLRYVRTGAQPPLPRVCTTANTLEEVVESADVFWYDDRSNQYQDIALQQETTLIGLCPHAGGSGRCDFASPPSN